MSGMYRISKQILGQRGAGSHIRLKTPTPRLDNKTMSCVLEGVWKVAWFRQRPADAP